MRLPSRPADRARELRGSATMPQPVGSQILIGHPLSELVTRSQSSFDLANRWALHVLRVECPMDCGEDALDVIQLASSLSER
jgi:hypothetical protein